MVRQLRGEHPKRERAEGGGTWVAGLDVAGSSEDVTVEIRGTRSDELAREVKPRQDSTVLLVGRVDFADVGEDAREVVIEVEGVEWWTGRRHRDQYERLVALLRREWRVDRLAIDASGIGQPLAQFLTEALGEDRVDSVAFSAAKKSELGYDLLAAVGGGRLRWYAHGPDDLAAAEFWHEVDVARREVKPNQTLGWSVPEHAGHDDFISALALLVRAAAAVNPPAAATAIVAIDPYGIARKAGAARERDVDDV
jgi:hypothetical protein